MTRSAHRDPWEGSAPGLISEDEALAWRNEAWRGHEDIAVPDDEFEDEAAVESE